MAWCRGAKALFQPLERAAEAYLLDMHDQIDGTAAPDTKVPVDELGAGDGENAAVRAPLGRVGGIRGGVQGCQNQGQRQGTQAIGSEVPVHSSAIFGRMLVQSFMLKTWLDWVSRSIKAAVR